MQLLAESLLLAALGGLLSFVVAQWTLDLVASLIPADLPDVMLQYRLGTPAILFAAALAVATGILFGLFPALHSTRPDIVSALKGQTGQPAGSHVASRFRFSLATGQIALSMALLILAGLFTKSLFNASRVDLGFRTENLVTFGVSPGLNGYATERILALYERIEDELRALPGVTGVTSSAIPLIGGDNWGSSVNVQGFQRGPDVDQNSRYTDIGTDYFRTLGIPVVTHIISV